ncbi:uncharacterized protein AMSG_12452 [Thecamonas trahens ATCC 50062]|uniref:Thioredoxin domain-containing protein n=1 Tax=Thecamonas trahens ATCC 50062 TaxID=461836 RepID=A0A0L0DUR9_THETB|nr:hypothetical protein AMSG_12452 [Thecamonas trahens ATCC 50062]KNC55947.1 hypothetical protein AMSG_12452 [Thecamonas trahens ATCC 50062]|eukprot:XP_013752688.1 hypothetical protein AMSG_12452 [Thecamonas trahens ATCC 50062]
MHIEATSSSPAGPSSTKSYDVFLCHGSNDKGLMLSLRDKLVALGLRVFLDVKSLDAMIVQDPADCARLARDSHVVVVVVSKYSIVTRWAIAEADAALADPTCKLSLETVSSPAWRDGPRDASHPLLAYMAAAFPPQIPNNPVKDLVAAVRKDASSKAFIPSRAVDPVTHRGAERFRFDGSYENVINIGGSLVAGGCGKNVDVLDVLTGERVEVLEGHTDCVNGVLALPSADGQQPVLVSWSRDNTIRVWHAADDGTGAMRYTANRDSCEVLEGHTYGVEGVIALPSADSQLPVLVSWSFDGTIRVWHPADDGTGAMRYTANSASCKVLKGHTSWVNGVIALPSADGQLPLLVSWSADNTIRVWPADDGTGAMRYTANSASCEVLDGHTKCVQGVIAQLPVLVSWSEDKTVRVWHAADDGTGAMRYTADSAFCEVLEGHTYGAQGVIALPSAHGQLPVLVSWSFDGTIRVWHPADDGTGAMRYTADSASCEVLEGHTSGVNGVIALPSADGQQPVLVSWSDDKTIRMWHAADDGTGAMRYTADSASCEVLEGHTSGVNGVIALPSADGQLPLLVSWSADNTIRVWPADDGTGAMRYTANSASCKVLKGHTSLVRGVIALPSANGQLPVLVSWSGDNTIRVWHAADDRTDAMRYTADSASCEVLEGRTGNVKGVIALPSADSQLPVLVSWSGDETIRVWHAADDGTGAMRYTANRDSCEVLEGHTYGVRDVIALPSAHGQLPVLVSWSWDNTIRVWHAADDGTGAIRYTAHRDSCEVLDGHTKSLFAATTVAVSVRPLRLGLVEHVVGLKIASDGGTQVADDHHADATTMLDGSADLPPKLLELVDHGASLDGHVVLFCQDHCDEDVGKLAVVVDNAINNAIAAGDEHGLHLGAWVVDVGAEFRAEFPPTSDDDSEDDINSAVDDDDERFVWEASASRPSFTAQRVDRLGAVGSSSVSFYADGELLARHRHRQFGPLDAGDLAAWMAKQIVPPVAIADSVDAVHALTDTVLDTGHDALVALLILGDAQLEAHRPLLTHRHHAHPDADTAPTSAAAFIHAASLLRHEATFAAVPMTVARAVADGAASAYDAKPHRILLEGVADKCAIESAGHALAGCIVAVTNHAEGGRDERYPHLEVYHDDPTTSPGALRAFFERQLHPLVAVLTPANVAHYEAMQLPVVYVFVPRLESDNDDDRARVARLRDLLLPIANSYRHQLRFGLQDAATYVAHARHLGLATDGAWPALAIEDHPLHYAYHLRGERLPSSSPLKLKRFLASFLAGKLEPTLVSEPVPSSAAARGKATRLVGSTFERAVLTASKPTLVMLYAPWCGHSQRLLPVLDDLAALYHGAASPPRVADEHIHLLRDAYGSREVNVAIMDFTRNDVPGKRGNRIIRAFPTILLYSPSHHDEPAVFGGDARDDLVSILRWLRRTLRRSDFETDSVSTRVRICGTGKAWTYRSLSLPGTSMAGAPFITTLSDRYIIGDLDKLIASDTNGTLKQKPDVMFCHDVDDNNQDDDLNADCYTDKDPDDDCSIENLQDHVDTWIRDDNHATSSHYTKFDFCCRRAQTVADLESTPSPNFYVPSKSYDGGVMLDPDPDMDWRDGYEPTDPSDWDGMTGSSPELALQRVKATSFGSKFDDKAFCYHPYEVFELNNIVRGDCASGYKKVELVIEDMRNGMVIYYPHTEGPQDIPVARFHDEDFVFTLCCAEDGFDCGSSADCNGNGKCSLETASCECNSDDHTYPHCGGWCGDGVVQDDFEQCDDELDPECDMRTCRGKTRPSDISFSNTAYNGFTATFSTSAFGWAVPETGEWQRSAPATVTTNCNCPGRPSTTPQNFAVTQKGTEVFFAWNDATACEDRFTVHRRLMSDPQPSIIASYSLPAKDACSTEPLAPTSDADNVANLILGSTYEYSIEAKDSISGFTSARATAELNVDWVATIMISVLSTSGTGIVGTSVVVTYPGSAVPLAMAVTDRSGAAQLAIQIPNEPNAAIELMVHASKTTAGNVHTYKCAGGSPCNSTLVSVTHLGTAQAQFMDVSVVSVAGLLTVASTAEYTEDARPCPVADPRAYICSYHAVTFERLECTRPDAAGAYALTFPVGISVHVMASWQLKNVDTTEKPNFEFAPAIGKSAHKMTPLPLASAYTGHGSIESITVLGASSTRGSSPKTSLPLPSFLLAASIEHYEGVDFEDQTAVELSVEVAGGKCNFPIGPGVVRLIAATCPKYIRRVVAGSSSSYISTFALPAMLFDATFEDIDAMQPHLWVPGISVGQVGTYFRAVLEDRVEADLRSGSSTARYEFHVPPQISMKGISFSSSSCGYAVLPLESINYVALVFEEHFTDHMLCRDFPITSPNLVAESRDEKPRVAATIRVYDTVSTQVLTDGSVYPCATDAGCEVPLQHGWPAHAILGGVDNVTFLSWPIAVAGELARPGGFLMRMPTEVVTSKLYDPPGGLSTSYVENGKSVETTFEYATGGEFTREQSMTLGHGVKIKNTACVGAPGATTCTDTVDTTIALEHTAEMAFTLGSDTSQTEGTMTMKSDKMTTSDDPAFIAVDDGAGNTIHYPDLLVMPALTVKFTPTDKVAFDADAANSGSCESEHRNDGLSKTTSIQWAPEPTSVLLYHTIYDAVTGVLPELHMLLMLEHKNPKSDPVQIDRLTKSIHAWNLILLAHNLDYEIAQPIELGDASELVFSGGGYTIERTSVEEVSDGDTYDFSFYMDTAVQSEAKFDTTLFQSKVAIGLTTKFAGQVRVGNSETSNTVTSNEVGFTLGDGELGDYFQVKVFESPKYGTPLFKTTGGVSKCPHEIGTTPREAVAFNLLTSGTVINIPPLGAASFEAEIVSTSPTQEAMVMNLRPDLVTNPDGLVVKLNGAPFIEPVEIAAGYNSPTKVTFTASRGPSAYIYDNVAIKAVSLCEDEQYYTMGTLSRSAPIEGAIALSARFLQPCAGLSWAGDLQRQGKFLINTASLETAFPNKIRGLVYNPEYYLQAWSEHPRLASVQLEWRRRGTATWERARDASLDVIDLVAEEDMFGFGLFEWDVANFLDGFYELRAVAQCVPTGRDDLDATYATVLSGVIDRVPPAQLGEAEPADGVYFPGDAISIAFTEDIDCEAPTRFLYSVMVDRVPRPASTLKVRCEGNTISFGIDNTLPLSSLAGAEVIIALSNVYDLADNVAPEVFEWVFSVYPVQVKDTSVRLDGLVFGSPYGSLSPSPQAWAGALIADLEIAMELTLGPSASGPQPASSADVRVSAGIADRMRVSFIGPNPANAGSTIVSLFVTAGNNPPADDLASAVRAIVSSGVEAVTARAARGLRASRRAHDLFAMTLQDRKASESIAIRAIALPTLATLVASNSTVDAVFVPSQSDEVTNAVAKSKHLAQVAAGDNINSDGEMRKTTNEAVIGSSPSSPSASDEHFSLLQFALINGSMLVVSVAVIIVSMWWFNRALARHVTKGEHRPRSKKSMHNSVSNKARSSSSASESSSGSGVPMRRRWSARTDSSYTYDGSIASITTATASEYA